MVYGRCSVQEYRWPKHPTAHRSEYIQNGAAIRVSWPRYLTGWAITHYADLDVWLRLTIKANSFEHKPYQYEEPATSEAFGEGDRLLKPLPRSRVTKLAAEDTKDLRPTNSAIEDLLRAALRADKIERL
jgi:hypothetical protein